MVRKKHTKGKQMSIERAMAKVLLDMEAKQKVKKTTEAEKVRRELLKKEPGLSEFARIYLNYKNIIGEKIKRNPLLRDLFRGRESSKLTVLTKLHRLKRQKVPFNEETILEILKTVRKNPKKYSKDLDKTLKETVERKLKGILSYTSLSPKGKELLVEELVRHKLFNEIICNSDSRAYWIGRIIKERRLR